MRIGKTFINLPVIGFVGKKGSGKSSCAAHLEQFFPVTRNPFAYRIKKMFGALGLSPQEIHDHSQRDVPLEKLSGKTPRVAMQTLGTDWAREMMHKDFWVNLWKIDTQQSIFNRRTVVTEDVRFCNEAEMIKKLGGILIRVTRPGQENNDLHKSETEQDDIKCDLEIVNDGSLDELCSELRSRLAAGWTGLAEAPPFQKLIPL